MAFKIGVDPSDATRVFLVDAFRPKRNFSLQRALVYCHGIADLDRLTPSFLGPKQWCCPTCGSVMSAKSKIASHKKLGGHGRKGPDCGEDLKSRKKQKV